jgi:hypothetical protein
MQQPARIAIAFALCFWASRAESESAPPSPGAGRGPQAKGEADLAAEVAKALAPEIRANTAVMQKLVELLEGKAAEGAPARREPAAASDAAAETAAEVFKKLAPALEQQTELLARLSDSIDRLSNRIGALNANIPGAAAAVAAPLEPAGGGPHASRPLLWPRYPIRPEASWWTGCAGWRHLMQGDHAGLFDPGWLASLSNAEIQSLHSDHHERRVHWDRVVRQASRGAIASGAPAAPAAPDVRLRASSPTLIVEATRRHHRRRGAGGACPDGLCPLLRR